VVGGAGLQGWCRRGVWLGGEGGAGLMVRWGGGGVGEGVRRGAGGGARGRGRGDRRESVGGG